MLSRKILVCTTWCSILCSLLCIALLAGCNVSPSGISTATATPNLDGSPKGPGSANLTATALASPVATPTCPILNATPASTSGWQTYRDSPYHFQFAFPQGWQPNLSTGDTNDHTTDVFPPGSAIPPQGIAAGSPEYFQISILLTGTPSDPAHDPNWQPALSNLSIGGIKTTLYARPAVECDEKDRMAVADFGHHHYTFYMTAKPAQAQQDIALFLGLLQSFQYTGIA
jgi:hypothetical protein